MKKPYLIAEAGVNFYDTSKAEGISLLDAAKKYIVEAGRAGVDAVKFQSYKADTIVSKDSPAYWDLEKEPTKTQYELFEKHDSFDAEDYRILADFCKEQGVAFLSTPFDYASADYLEDMVEVYKISSSDLSNIPFIRHIAKKGKPIYLSVGAAYLSEIEEAVRVIKGEGIQEKDICLLHCILSYPTKEEDANLNMIKTLKRVFPNCMVGYSDHTIPDDSMTALTCAYLYGAEVLEKHFTLDKSLQGNDHYHAGDPEDFRKAAANFEKLCILSGKGEKTVLPCEETSRLQARRSIVLIQDMKKGDIITADTIMCKRPGTGISPKNIDLILGRCVKQDMKADTILTWDMI